MLYAPQCQHNSQASYLQEGLTEGGSSKGTTDSDGILDRCRVQQRWVDLLPSYQQGRASFSEKEVHTIMSKATRQPDSAMASVM